MFNQKAKFARRIKLKEHTVITQTLRNNGRRNNVSKTHWGFWRANDSLSRIKEYCFTNSKGNIHITGFIQAQVEAKSGLASGAFNKLVKSSVANRKLIDNSQDLLINGKRLTFSSMNTLAKYLNISRSYLASKMKSSRQFSIKGYEVKNLKDNDLKGYISYREINPLQRVIDIRI